MPAFSDRNPASLSGAVDLSVIPKLSTIGAFEVRRTLPSSKCRSLGPFVFLDQFGPALLTPDKLLDVPPHPHIGLATVTWLFEGEIMHRDSLGSAEIIRPGELNWMTAGCGIVHSERTPEHLRNVESTLFGVQCWVALPIEKQESEPGFTHYSAVEIPRYRAEGVQSIVAIGSVWGVTSPVETTSETILVQVDMEADSQIDIPRGSRERGLYLVSGRISIAGNSFDKEQLIVLHEGVEVSVSATEAARFMLLGGTPLDGRRHMYWNFVHTEKERIEKAKDDWRRHRFATIPGDEDEFTPLPD